MLFMKPKPRKAEVRIKYIPADPQKGQQASSHYVTEAQWQAILAILRSTT